MKNSLLAILLISFISFLFIHSSIAQPNIEWAKSLGGSEEDRAFCVKQTDFLTHPQHFSSKKKGTLKFFYQLIPNTSLQRRREL